MIAATNKMSPFADAITKQKYAHDKEDATKESWAEIAWRAAYHTLSAVNAPLSQIEATAKLIEQRKFIPGGRYLYASGRPFHQVQNCLLMRIEDSREGWADHLQKCSMALMTGAGIGIDYSLIREEDAPIRKTGGKASGPLSIMKITNEVGRYVMQGGSRRSAIWAGLNWAHADVMKFIHMKNWSPEVRAMKEKDFNFPADMDMTNISVQLDDAFFAAYHCNCVGWESNPYQDSFACYACGGSHEAHRLHYHAVDVYWAVIRQMLTTAEPGFSVDCGENAGETLRNACTEVCSHDDSDICNLGSINMARIESLTEMQQVVMLGTAFLLAGTVYSDVPYQKVDEVRTKNRRLGLGLMGLHEWMLLRGQKYGPSPELADYMGIYATSTDVAAQWADQWNLSRPIKTRAIAPTGTIGIIAETTGGLEPLFCVAYKRRYLDGLTWQYQYVVDPTAKRLIDSGVNPDSIEDAYSLAKEPERRIAFQSWLQQYVDHGISSTLNLPAWGTEHNCEEKLKSFGDMLITYLPKLRGFTCYPDSSRGGQPITAVKYQTAMKHVGQVFYEAADICDITRGGSCGA